MKGAYAIELCEQCNERFVTNQRARFGRVWSCGACDERNAADRHLAHVSRCVQSAKKKRESQRRGLARFIAKHPDK